MKRKTARERYVFNDNGKKIGDFKRSFYTVCKNAGLKNMHIHDLRRVFASKIVIGGTSLYITGELLGHRTYLPLTRHEKHDFSVSEDEMTYKRMPFMGIAIWCRRL